MGTSTWLSAATWPWPGKCLPQLAMPAWRMPSIRLLASSVTMRASRWNERSPMTALWPKCRSSTGAKLRSTPHERSSAAITKPAAVAASVAAIAPSPAGARAVVHPAPAVGVHRRQVREAVGAKALHAAAFMVDAHQQVGPDRLHLGHQLGDLLAIDPVASEQDRAARERVREAAAVVGGQLGAGDVEDDRRVVGEPRVGHEVQRLAELRDDARLAGRLPGLGGLLDLAGHGFQTWVAAPASVAGKVSTTTKVAT